jgi:hypothetical protein
MFWDLLRRTTAPQTRVQAGTLPALLLAAVFAITAPEAAHAVPSFAIQTGQPCAACHIGAFGPQLTPYGRDFKLHGYTASDGKDHGLPLAFTTQTSFTHTQSPQPGGAAPGFRDNDNFAVDQLSLYYAGTIAPNLGGFIELNYDGVAQKAALNNVDIRYVREGQLFGQDVLWGITVNNNPTVQDPWNSTPAWGFPYNQSALAPTPMASTLVDGGLGQRVVGVGMYTLWNDFLYLEGDLYKGLDAPTMTALGQVPDDGDQTTSFIPYARVAMIKDWGDKKNHAEIGAYGLSAKLDTMRFDVSYSFAATVTPSFQYFRTVGTSDANYWTTPNGSPNSDGMILEVAYVPWGKPDSPFPNMNVRLAVQYINYFSFDGMYANASKNNNFYFSLWTAMKF